MKLLHFVSKHVALDVPSVCRTDAEKAAVLIEGHEIESHGDVLAGVFAVALKSRLAACSVDLELYIWCTHLRSDELAHSETVLG